MIGDDPVCGLVSRDNSLLYVANLHSQEVTVYSIDDGKRVGSVHVATGPAPWPFPQTGHLLFVVDRRSGDVAVVRTAISQSLLTMIPVFTMISVGRAPNAIADKAFNVH